MGDVRGGEHRGESADKQIHFYYLARFHLSRNSIIGISLQLVFLLITIFTAETYVIFSASENQGY